MKNRRFVLFAGFALAALLVAGALFLALRPAPHMPTFEPPSQLKPEEYASKSEAELIKLGEAGDWGAVKGVFFQSLSGDTNLANIAGRLLRRYADQGYDEARTRLGGIHLMMCAGQGSPELFENTDFLNEPRNSWSTLLRNRQERKMHAETLKTRGIEFGDFREGIRLLELAAEGGHPAAQSVLGNLLLQDNYGCRQNIPRALDLLERAARGGDTQAAGVLCQAYYQGTLAARDDAKCLEFARLTKNPLIPACLIALNGRGDRNVLPDLLRELEALEKKHPDWNDSVKIVQARLALRTKPAAQADEWASQRLDDDLIVADYDNTCRSGEAAWFYDDPAGVTYFFGNSGPLWVGRRDIGVTTCVADARSGDRLAQYVLGCSRLLLIGDKPGSREAANDRLRGIFRPAATDKEKAEGVEWLRKSAAQGFHAAMGKLGECLLRGVGVKADKAEAAYWLTLATTDIHTRYAKLRDEALATLTPAERETVERRVSEKRKEIAARRPDTARIAGAPRANAS